MLDHCIGAKGAACSLMVRLETSARKDQHTEMLLIKIREPYAIDPFWVEESLVHIRRAVVPLALHIKIFSTILVSHLSTFMETVLTSVVESCLQPQPPYA